VLGRHGGRSGLGKAGRLAGRLSALRRWGSRREFNVALAHGSHELTITARRLGIPSATTFDYEWAWLQHQLGCRTRHEGRRPGTRSRPSGWPATAPCRRSSAATPA
jgi:hypothetical protein